MIEESEVVVLLLGLATLLFMTVNRRRLRRLPRLKVLASSFLLLLAGWTLTILEGFVLHEHLNLLEHACYAASALMIAGWIWTVFTPGVDG
ncbi:MAG: hypothetical protein R6U10_01595 [Thermoplasmatota archaeon]